jgi:hypothetical protein
MLIPLRMQPIRTPRRVGESLSDSSVKFYPLGGMLRPDEKSPLRVELGGRNQPGSLSELSGPLHRPPVTGQLARAGRCDERTATGPIPVWISRSGP